MPKYPSDSGYQEAARSIVTEIPLDKYNSKNRRQACDHPSLAAPQKPADMD
jgi:hypothetical protein